MRALVNGVRLFFDIEGTALLPSGSRMVERPMIVALHGGPGADHSTLRPALTPLSKFAQVLYLDFRGHGRSEDGPVDSWTLTQLADDVAGVCDRLDLEHPIIYGQSFGSIVAMEYAIRHPDQPRALVLVGATAVGQGVTIDRVAEAFRRVGGDKAAQICRWDAEVQSPESQEEWMRYCWPHVTKQTAASAELWRARVVQHPHEIVAHLNAETRLMDLRPDLGHIPCPVLVVVGHDDPMTPPQAANEIADGIGRDRARVRVIRDAAHTVLLDQPQLTHATIADFLTELGVAG